MELRYAGVASATEAECPRAIGLGSLPLTLGRKAAAGVTVVTGPTSVANGKLLSRKHAVISRDAASGALRVCDLGSVNGTWLDGAKLPPRAEHPLEPGDITGSCRLLEH